MARRERHHGQPPTNSLRVFCFTSLPFVTVVVIATARNSETPFSSLLPRSNFVLFFADISLSRFDPGPESGQIICEIYIIAYFHSLFTSLMMLCIALLLNYLLDCLSGRLHRFVTTEGNSGQGSKRSNHRLTGHWIVEVYAQ